MATAKSFKQQCPSCEAMVPVRDPSLIGKKIDCPKCKYRFVVQEPGGDEDEDAPKKKGDKAGKPAAKGGKAAPVKGKTSPNKKDDDEDDDRPARKKKAGGGSNLMLVMGIGLALVAVTAIVVCIFAIPWGDSGTPGANSNPAPAPAPTGDVPVVGADAGADAAKTPASTELGNVTNLLPNNTQVVVSYPMDRLLGSAIKTAALEAEGAFKPGRLEKQLGVQLTDISRVLTAQSEKDNWVFTVVRTRTPIKEDLVKAGLRLEVQSPKIKSKSGKMRDTYLVRGELDGLGALLLQANKPKEAFAVYFHEDKHTLVFADPAPLQKFLEQDCQPEFRTKPPAPAAAPGDMGNTGGTPPMGSSGTPPMGDIAPMRSSGTPPMGSSGTPPMGSSGTPPMGSSGTPPMGSSGTPPMGSGPPGSGTDQAAPVVVAANWLTIDPALKAILDRIEKEEENRETKKREPASCVTVAYDFKVDFDLFGKDMPGLALKSLPAFKNQKDVTAMITLIKPMIKNAGFALVALDQTNFNFIVALEVERAIVARDQERAVRRMLAGLLEQYRPNKLNLALAGGLVSPPPGTVGPGSGSTTGMPPGMNSDISPMAPPRGSSSSSSSSSSGPPPGSSGQPPRGSSSGDITPPGMGQPGMGTGEEEKKDGTLTLGFEDRILSLQGEIVLNAQAYKDLLALVDQQVVVLKSEADLLGQRSWVHELAAAMQTYVGRNGAFPQGAQPRPAATDRNLPWRPEQRLSLFAALVPLLGEEYADWRFEPEKSWDEGRNLNVAQRVIPHLVATKQLKPAEVTLRYPGVEAPVAAGYFVGVAGVGLDAAEYTDAEATAKKRGVFGYDRVTKKNDIKDGLDQTIVLLLSPSDQRAPWLAAGGSTVRGVLDEGDEGNPLEPFVCVTFPAKASGRKAKWEGKKGTLAVMADGKVRFIPADMAPETFRAMCTIAGGERISRLDDLAPVIEGDSGERELKGGGVGLPGAAQPKDPPKEKAPAPVPAPAPAPAPPPAKEGEAAKSDGPMSP